MESDNNAVIKYIPENPGQLLADFAEKRVKEIEAEDKAINDNLRRFESRVFTAFGSSYYDDDKD
jgi:hypothetical protein